MLTLTLALQLGPPLHEPAVQPHDAVTPKYPLAHPAVQLPPDASG
jgi:hypothetical protein